MHYLKQCIDADAINKTQIYCKVLLNLFNWGFFPRWLRPGGEGRPSPPSSGEVRNDWSCFSAPPYAFVACTETLLNSDPCLVPYVSVSQPM